MKYVDVKGLRMMEKLLRKSIESKNALEMEMNSVGSHCNENAEKFPIFVKYQLKKNENHSICDNFYKLILNFVTIVIAKMSPLSNRVLRRD